MMLIDLDTSSVESYRQFLRIKALPRYSIRGRTAWFPDEYADRIGIEAEQAREITYTPPAWMFDYQRSIIKLAIVKQRYAVFADCGLGKTAILLEFAKHASRVTGKRTLIVSPLMVIEQTIAEAARFFGDTLAIQVVPAKSLAAWLTSGSGVAITNYEAIRDDLPQGDLGCLILDESSMLKSHYGKWGTRLIELGKAVPYKLCCTGTPAPNDRIEYANHAIFLDQFPTVNSFLARYFINRGQTAERWELKPHALHPFYRSLSHWCIFLSNPATYGWKDNCENIPPICVHVENVDMTNQQSTMVQKMTGELFASRMGGITNRSVLGSIGKGFHKGRRIDTLKPAYIKQLVDSWPQESTIVWCLYNEEQRIIEETFPDAASIDGGTPHETRMRLIEEFKVGQRKVLISKPKILGFGLNLQRATRQVFSGLQDSYETFYQAVKRSNRYGSTKPLNVHIPVTDIELPMVENVLRKAKLVQQDTEEQERIFRENYTINA